MILETLWNFYSNNNLKNKIKSSEIQILEKDNLLLGY